MKLHLPKSLRLSLLSALSLATPFALTLGSTAWGGSWNANATEEYNFTGTDDVTELNTEGHVGDNGTFVKANAANLNITLTKITQVADTKLTITGTWNNTTNAFNALTVQELVIGDGNGSGELTIADDFKVNLTTQRINIEKISGTVSNLIVDTYGVLQLGTEGGTNTFTISAGTVESGGKLNLVGGTYNITGLSNSGTVVINEGSIDVELNNLVDKTDGKYNPNVISNTSTGNLVIENTGAKTLNSAITIANGGTVTLKGGTFGTAENGIASTIKTEESTFLAFENISVTIGGDADSNQMLDADIIVGNGATLTMTVGDRYHYTNSHTLKVLTGGSVVLGNTRQSLAAGFEVILAGGTITGEGDDDHSMALDFYDGGKITVTETGSLDANVGGHQDDDSITFDVTANKTLTMTGDLVKTGVAKSGSGTLVLTGNTDLNSINITGGHLTFGGGDQVTHTVSGEIKSDSGSGSSVFKVETGSTLSAGSVNNAWGMTMEVDGKLYITGDAGLILKSNSTETISGAGSIETTKIDFGNHSKFTFTLDSLIVGEGGIVFDANQTDQLFSINGTDVEVTGAVNAQNGAMELKNGSLVLKASEGNYFNKFNYVNGALTHTALTIKDAEFSGQTLVNTGALTLNGVVNVTDTRNLLKGEGEYSDAENGNGFFSGEYYIIKGEEGSSLTYGDAFAVQYQGAEVGTETVTKGASDLLISLEDTSTYYVNKGTVIFAGENATADTDKASSFVVKSGATLQLGGDVADGMSAKQVLMTTLGSGKIKLASNVALSHSGEGVQFEGSLDIESGATLTLGRVYNKGTDSTSSNTTEYDINISSLSSLNLNGGTLQMYYVAPHIKSMTVVESSENSKIYIDDVWGSKQTAKSDATRIDTLVLNSALTIETNWKSNTNIGVLSGSGDLTAKQTNANESVKSQLWIDGLNNYSGNISLIGKMALTLNINAGQTFLASQLTVGSGSSASLVGSGVYDLGSATSLGSGVTLSDDWTGVVRMSNATVSAFNINSYGHADSYLELIGVNGWLQNTSSAKLTGLILSKSEDGTLNGFTVTDSSSQTYNFNGKVKGDGDFTIATKSSNNVNFAFNGDLSEFAGGIKVEAGDNGSTPTIGINLAGGGDIFAAESNGGVHVNRGGTVNLNIGKSGETTNMRGAVINEGAGTLNVTVQGDTAFKAAVDASKMTLNSGVGVTLGNGANRLTYDLGTVVAHSGGNTITLEQGATLNAFTKGSGSGTITLTGSGVYDLGNAQKTYNTDSTGTPKVNENNNFTLASEWTGTVRIVGAVHQTNKLGLNLNNLSNANSAVELINVNGWFTATMAGKLILTEDEAKNAAWTINNGGSKSASDSGYDTHTMGTFTGSVSGNGTMKYEWTNGGSKYSGYTFSGDLSQWSGMFEQAADGKCFNLTLNQNANDVGAEIKNSSSTGELHLRVETIDAATFKKDVTVSKLSLSRSSTFNKTLKVSDTVTVAQGESLHLGDKVSISGTSDASSTMKAVEMSTSGIKGTAADSAVNSSLIELKNATSYSIENTTFDDVKLTAAQNAIIQLQNVQGDAVLSGGNYVMQAVYGSAVEQMSTSGNTTLQYQVAGNWTVDNAQTTTITLTSTPGADCGHQLGVYDLVFTLNLDFTSGAVQPTTIDGWKALVTFGGQMATLLDEQQAEYAMSGTEEALALTNPYVMYDYNATDNMLIVTVTGLTVPEPTTATLSLLALAALASRRRRASR